MQISRKKMYFKGSKQFDKAAYKNMNKISVLKRSIWKFYRGKMISPRKILEISNFIAQKFYAYRQYLDSGFEKRICFEFASRLNELYCIEALLNNKMKLEHRRDKGPDIWIENIKGWGEFVAATDTAEQIKKYKEEKDFSSDENYHLSRLTNVIKTKLKRIQGYLKDGLIHDDEPIVLFVSSAYLKDSCLISPKGFVNTYLRAVFPIGEATIYVNPIAKTSELRRDYKSGFPKINGAKIENDFFIKKENDFISAIVFSHQTILQPYFCPDVKFKSGDDFVIVHNPKPKIKVPIGFLKSHHEYECSFENGILSIKDCKVKEDAKE